MNGSRCSPTTWELSPTSLRKSDDWQASPNRRTGRKEDRVTDGSQRTRLMTPTLLRTTRRSPGLTRPSRAPIRCASRRPWVSCRFCSPRSSRLTLSHVLTALRTGLGAIDWNADTTSVDSPDLRESEAAEQRSQWVVNRLKSREDEFTLKEDIKCVVGLVECGMTELTWPINCSQNLDNHVQRQRHLAKGRRPLVLARWERRRRVTRLRVRFSS